MTDNAPVGQVEAASDEQVADWKRIATEDYDGPTDDAILALIARIEAERDRASAAQAFIRQGRQGTENTELRELLRVARCPNQECDGGVIPVALGEHYVTHDMAIDAGDPSLEGQSMGVEWGAEQCRWCYERDEAIEKKLSKEEGDA